MTDDPATRPAIGPEPATQPPPLIIAPESEAVREETAETLEATAEPSALAAAGKLIVSSGSGRAGLAMFALMVALSAWVLITYPPNFGSARWSNPAVWANNPKNAPPVWTARFTGGTEQRVFALDAPTATRAIPAGEVRTYTFPLDVGDRAPSSLALGLSDLTYWGRPPAILASLVRPDGGQIRLAAVPAPAPRPGEEAPYHRFDGAPERVSLTEQTAAQSIAGFFAQQHPDLPATIGSATVALFGRPDPGGSGAIVPLPGEYAVETQVVVADPRDEIGAVGLTAGGDVYGLMGTDGLGRDLWEGLLYGFPVGLAIATLTAIASTAIGASLGVLSGYVGGRTDLVVQRFADIVSNVPTLPLLIFLVSILGRHLWLIMLVLVLFSWPGLTILVRSMVLQIRGGSLVEAAQALGASRGRIMLRHVFPQVAPYIVAQMIFFAPGAILAEASLSFLGLGDPSIPTWGQMLEAGFRTGALYVGYWWWVLPPGILIVLTAVAFMLLALALEPVVDPRLRRPS